MFADRLEAGSQLAEKLLLELPKESLEKTIVLAVPRGGVVIGSVVAKKFGCPLDVIVTRKIGSPGEQELAIGAIGETDGSKFLNEQLIDKLGVSQQYLKEEIKRQQEEIKRREHLYRQGRGPLDLKNKQVVIVDDGAATGATLLAAAREVWNHSPKKIIIALPVAPPDTIKKLEEEVDKVITLSTPKPFFAVGQFYKEFEQIGDDKVIALFKEE